MTHRYPIALCMVTATALAGCESLALTAFGVGASAGVNQTLNGTIYRTFTFPVREVRNAALDALKQMGISVDATAADTSGPIIAHAAGREIQIDFEAISPNSTRMRAVAKSATWFYDAATGREIVAQTEKALAEATARAALPSSAPAESVIQAVDPAAAPTVKPILLVPPPTVISPER
jgi:phage-related tail protein